MWSGDTSDEEYDVEEPSSLPDRFLWATSKGKLDVVKEILQQDKSVISFSDGDGYTALHKACSEGYVEIAKFLLSKNANVHARTIDGWTPLHSACRWNETEIAKVLIDNGADINALSNGNLSPLHVAAAEKTTRDIMVLLLHCKDIDVHIKSNAGDTALDLSKRFNSFSSLFEIVEKHVNEF
ncbi:ankyrin repeat domain-containing protein 49-like [Clavelina lepadiformis]|uniref:Ankyrin repeat domain-containing protein 49 n=1 Tax=Clavelina lepadiformis TaxID=159417 RepID=A0ABP0GIN7_CLALP